jgi:hypothetical protein
MEVRVRTQPAPCEIYGGQSGNMTRFTMSTYVLFIITPPALRTLFRLDVVISRMRKTWELPTELMLLKNSRNMKKEKKKKTP